MNGSSPQIILVIITLFFSHTEGYKLSTTALNLTDRRGCLGYLLPRGYSV